MKKLVAFCKSLPQYASKPWYPYAMALVAFADYFLFVIPLDIMVVTSVVAARKRWFSISFWTCLGSTLGAALFGWLIQIYGHPFLQKWAPHLLEDKLAVTITQWLHDYGFWALVGIAAAPLHQHPTVAIAALANISILTIFITMFIGRFVKYMVYSWLSLHAKKGFERFFKE